MHLEPVTAEDSTHAGHLKTPFSTYSIDAQLCPILRPAKKVVATQKVGPIDLQSHHVW